MINIIKASPHSIGERLNLSWDSVDSVFSTITMMITPEMFTPLLLPPIIFQETFHTDVKELIKDSDSNGVTMAPIIGELVAQSLCEGETVDLLKPFDPLRF